MHLYKTSETEDSTKHPRAVIEINPEADPEKFPIDANASEKVVKQTAQRITNEMVKRINAGPKYEQLKPLRKTVVGMSLIQNRQPSAVGGHKLTPAVQENPSCPGL